MTSFVFIRHGETDHTGSILSGRTPEVSLNERGQQQAASLPERLQHLPPDLICTSPLERCRQTVEPLARACNLEARVLPDLLELNYGAWQGKSPAQLDDEDDYWREYNQFRSLRRIPAGEMLVEVQLRMLHALELLQREAPGARVAIVGHSDPIKSALAYLLGTPLDFINRLTIAPGSVSIGSVGQGEPRVHCINVSGHIQADCIQ